MPKTINKMTSYLYQVGVRCLETGVWGAYYNILTNLPDNEDKTYKEQVSCYNL